jgi:transposase
MHSEKYIEILGRNLFDIFANTNLIFQDDNDSKHRSELTTLWKNEYEITSIDWPSNSPDLNPIENVWSILKNKVSKVKVNTKEEFIKCIENKWNEISQETINNIIDSMPKRIKEVINNEGDSINY